MCYRCDDPVPGTIDGDPSTVQRFANQFSTTSNALRDAAKELRRLANEDITISLAVDEVRENADAIADDTDRVAERYEGAASNFSSYASALESARSAGNGARTHIVSNNASGRYWRHRERDLRQQVQWGSTDAEVLEDLQEATRRANHFDAQYATYIGQYQAAIEDRDQAVTAAINGLANAEAASGLNDGFWDGIAGDFQMAWELASKYLGPVLEIIRTILEELKKIVDFLALVFAVLAIFFPAFAAIAAGLAALSAIMGILIFACSALLFLMGRETLGQVLADGIMAVVGVVTAKLGVNGWAKESLGQMMSNGLKAATSTAGSTVVTRALQPAISNAAEEFFLESGLHATIEATGEIFSYAASEGLDFSIGMNLTELEFDMSGADPRALDDSVTNFLTMGVTGMGETIHEGLEVLVNPYSAGFTAVMNSDMSSLHVGAGSSR